MIRPLAFFLTIVAGVLQSRADTVLYYHFDEGPLNQFASNVIDSGPNNIQGIGRNVGTASLPVFRNAPSPGLWMQFNGKGDSIPTVASFVEIEDPGNSPLDLTGPMTIEAVIHPTLIDHQVITRKFTLAGSGYNFDIDSGGHLTFRLQDDNTSAISSMALQPNKTYHVAGTWDGSMIRVYVNHALDGQFPYNGPLHANNDEMGIGAVIRIDDSIDDGFSGYMDSLRISNTALAPSQFLPIPGPIPLRPGDFNQDNVIDAADYVTWRNTRGELMKGCGGADHNCNGVVDDPDYQIWRTNFGQPQGVGASMAASGYEDIALAIPETTTGIMLLSMAAVTPLMCSRQRRRWRPVT